MRANLQIRKNLLKDRRKARIRGKIEGTATKPRVSVFKSNRYFYAQAIDDISGTTLASANNMSGKKNTTTENVKDVANAFGEILKQKNITEIVFDRNGYQYHGIVASFADALRETGINF
ncbi:MAG: 50S ribosomal protein L18 [Campylobacterales bacterium]|nr:50S ribosomal protein L18 [Campylobacterales bacterium]